MSDNLKHPCHMGEAAIGSPYRCPHCGTTVNDHKDNGTVDAQYVLDHAGEYEMVGLVPCAWTYKSDGKGSVRCGKDHNNEWVGLIESILKTRFRPVSFPAVTRTSFDDKRDGIPDRGLVVITLNDPAGKIVGYSTVWKEGPNGYPKFVSWGGRIFTKSIVSSEQYVEEPALETRVLCVVKDTYEAARVDTENP